MPSLREIELKDAFADTRLNAMDYVNAVVSEFPAAISFAPGFPLDGMCRLDEPLAAVSAYTARVAGGSESTPRLGQYSRPNGLIADVIVEHLARDEHIHVTPDDIVVTIGAQEAMAIVLAGLFDPRHDILLASDPTYFGMTGLARLLGIRVMPVTSGDYGLDPAAVDEAIVRASRLGRVRALYDVPDFSNPLGTSLSLSARLALLEVCRRREVFLIEDNPYGMFAYDRERLLTLKALDEDGSVLYIGSFSKTVAPGLRVGYLVANQRVRFEGGGLARVLSRVKSVLTVNTPPLSQAIVAGMLLQAGGSLEPLVAPKRAMYRTHRDAMVAALRASCADVPGVSWACPEGGFFLPLTVPFEFGSAELRRCALDYGVIACPMQFFCLDPARRTQMRLSFSYVDPARIRHGIDRLASFVRANVSTAAAH